MGVRNVLRSSGALAALCAILLATPTPGAAQVRAWEGVVTIPTGRLGDAPLGVGSMWRDPTAALTRLSRREASFRPVALWPVVVH